MCMHKHVCRRPLLAVNMHTQQLTLLPLVMIECTGHATLAACYQFEDRFCASKKGGIGGGGQVSARGAVHMAAALAGCRKALVSTGLGISLLFDTNGHR